MQITRTGVEDVVAFFGDELLPSIKTVEDLCAAQLLLDRSSGAGVVLSVWTGDRSTEAARGALEQQLLARARSRLGATHQRLESYVMIGTSMQLG